MRFPLPLFPAEFEIPDEWWSEAGMEGFRPPQDAYQSTVEQTHMVELRAIEPPSRFPEHPKDFHGFDRDRMIQVLGGFVLGSAIPPMPLLALPSRGFRALPFEYGVLDGFHRYYASVAAGFVRMPATIDPCVN